MSFAANSVWPLSTAGVFRLTRRAEVSCIGLLPQLGCVIDTYGTQPPVGFEPTTCGLQTGSPGGRGT
jgi:hypothetical protein